MKLFRKCQQAIMIIGGLLSGSSGLSGQETDQVLQVHAANAAGVDAVVTKTDGGSWASVRYREELVLGEVSFQGVDDDDAVLISWDENLTVTPYLHLRGPNNSYLGPIDEDDAGRLYFGGSFWALSQLNDLSLQANASSRALLLGQLLPNGENTWLKQIEGTGLKEITSVKATGGGVYIGGQFSGALLVDGMEWSHTTDGQGFVARFSDTGNLEWLSLLSGTDVEVVDMVVLSNGNLVVAGNFLGSMTSPMDTIMTQTPDEDGFIALLDDQGNWERLLQLGGVQRDIIQHIAINEQDDLLVGGDIVGTIFLPNGEQLASMNGFPDLFFIQLDADWNVSWADTGGGVLTEELAGLVWQDGLWWASGNSAGEWTWDAFSFGGDGGVDGFMIAIDESGLLAKGATLQGDDQLFVNSLATSVGDYPQVAGSYRGGSGIVGLGESPDFFAGFWLQLKNGPNAVTETAAPPGVKVWSGVDQIWIEAEVVGRWRMYDAAGRLLRSVVASPGRMAVPMEERKGIFFWTYVSRRGVHSSGKVWIH